MTASIPRETADWERAAARAIDAAGIAASPAVAARAGRTLSRLARSVEGDAAASSATRTAAAREGVAQRASFIAALAALAHD